MAMEFAALSPGVVVRLRDLHSSLSPSPSQSLRVLGRLERFDAASAIAVLTDDHVSLRVDLQHLRTLPLRLGSWFLFIGELEIVRRGPSEEFLLKARVGRNVDGMDLKLFDKVLELRRKHQWAENRILNEGLNSLEKTAVGNNEEDYKHDAKDKDANNADESSKVEEFNQEAN